MPIITSLLDTDLYKISMMQAALNQFPTTEVEYEFKCRNVALWNKDMLDRLNKEIDSYCNLRFTDDELEFLESIPYFKSGFIALLSLYQPTRAHIQAYLDIDNSLHIEVRGPWYLTMLFEVPVLAMVNEIYFEHTVGFTRERRLAGEKRLAEKIAIANAHSIPFADFGTRRRFNKNWQEKVVKEFWRQCPSFIGTSNVYLAKKYDLRVIGTMAHEYIMAGAGQDTVPLVKSQAYMLQKWVDEYRGDLGIALTDTYGFDAFLNDFDKYFAKLYDGLRHDSGDPMEWAEKAIAHYRKLGIDPKTKSLVFSDGLTMDIAKDLYIKLRSRAKVSFGIGTHLTNDFDSVTPLQIVMKIVTCNGRPVAKVSDTKGKGMCKDDEFIHYVKKVFKIGEYNG